MEPATTIIQKCGGVAKAARYAGVEPATAYRWTYPRERGGTGGMIPTHRQAVMIRNARADGVELLPTDFALPEEAA